MGRLALEVFINSSMPSDFYFLRSWVSIFKIAHWLNWPNPPQISILLPSCGGNVWFQFTYSWNYTCHFPDYHLPKGDFKREARPLLSWYWTAAITRNGHTGQRTYWRGSNQDSIGLLPREIHFALIGRVAQFLASPVDHLTFHNYRWIIT